MKKIILSALAFGILAVPAFSQEKAIKKTGFGDNWFIQLQGGASYTISENYKDASFGDLITPTVGIAFGKHLSPKFGLRAQASGWESKSQYKYIDDTYRHKYIQASLDGLVNITNLWSSEYNPNRVFNLYGFIGLAYVHGEGKKSINLNPEANEGKGMHLDKSNMIIPRVGLQADFQVTNFMSLNVEVSGNLLEDRFNGVSTGKAYDGMVTALGGVTFHFNRGFEQVEIIDPALVQDLNNKINDQRLLMNSQDAVISDLQAQLEKKPEVIVQEIEPLEEIVMNAVVVFKLGKSDLQENQEINIYNAAKFFQDNLDKDIVITGYADKATGNPTINKKLSERRAEAVAKILIEKYGIAPTRITTQASGDKVQPFQIDAWNRVVIFTAVPKKK